MVFVAWYRDLFLDMSLGLSVALQEAVNSAEVASSSLLAENEVDTNESFMSSRCFFSAPSPSSCVSSSGAAASAKGR